MYFIPKTSSNARALTHTPVGISRNSEYEAAAVTTRKMVHSFSRQLCVPVGLNRSCYVLQRLYAMFMWFSKLNPISL